jgi:hypothetical protein
MGLTDRLLFAIKIFKCPPSIRIDRRFPQIFLLHFIRIVDHDNRFEPVVRSQNGTAFSIFELD